jgi:hypothetical protein
MENEQRRRRKNHIVITGWRGEGKSKQQIKEDRKVYERKHGGSQRLLQQVLMEIEHWSGKEKTMKQKGKMREKKETEKIFIDNDLTKQEREILKKPRTIAKEGKREGKEVKVGYRKITINNRGGTVEIE